MQQEDEDEKNRRLREKAKTLRVYQSGKSSTGQLLTKNNIFAQIDVLETALQFAADQGVDFYVGVVLRLGEMAGRQYISKEKTEATPDVSPDPSQEAAPPRSPSPPRPGSPRGN